jgi:predicted Zn-dependent protease
VGDAAPLQALATMLCEAKIDADAEKCLNKYLRLQPKDASAWADLAKVQRRVGKRQAAIASFEQAVRAGANALQARIQREQELYDVYVEWMRQSRPDRRQSAPRVW